MIKTSTHPAGVNKYTFTIQPDHGGGFAVQVSSTARDIEPALRYFKTKTAAQAWVAEQETRQAG
jgi:hypothetical protein